jgi:hypothetical protein
MSVLSRASLASPQYIRLKCSCGRDLRARPEQAGSSITCWSCHASVPVPVPVAPGGWLARLLRVAARQVLDARIFILLALGAVSVTLALSLTALGVNFGPRVLRTVPRPGVWAAALALGLAMVGYGELLRRGCQGDWAPRPHVGIPARAWRAVLCLGIGVLLALPLITTTATESLPHLTPKGLALGLAASLILPLVMLGTYFPEGTIRFRLGVVVSTVRRHPRAVLASLLIVPLALPAIELLVFTLARITQTFSFMLFDLFPNHAGTRAYSLIPYYTPSELRMTWIDFREASDTRLLGTYADSLGQGYTLFGAISSSLALNHSNGFFLGSINLNEKGYLAFRMFFTLVMVTCMLSALAIQARWLGLLSTIDARRSGAPTGSTGLIALPNLTPEPS